MQKKPILTDTFTFENLIEKGGLYVDKTQYFHKLVAGAGSCYFCSRPRRFGKSLAISIFKNIFLGRKELFEGLYIANTNYDWDVYPVIHLDMAQANSDSPEKLSKSLLDFMNFHAKKYGIDISVDDPARYFNLLIPALREKTGKKVVLLIDEYDRPLTENLDVPEILESVRKVLETFYQIIKGQEPNERFVFMTGVTKFNKVSIFSKLNNLNDITIDSDYACMFGYTQDELENNFAPYIDDYVRESGADRAEFIENIRKWYNGFRFDYEAETVYNPVSVGQFFTKKCRFQNYWFATATPSFITKLAKKQRLEQSDIDEEILSDASLNMFSISDFASENVSKSSLIQLLFQTGYLTIGEKIPVDEVAFSLRFPNWEVENSFNKILFEAYCGLESRVSDSYVLKIKQAANEGKTERLIELFRNFLSEVPYTIQIPAEKYYQTVIFCILKMCGMDIEAECATNKGWIDAVMDTPRIVYIFEFKIDQSAKDAERQIMERGYFQRFIEGARDKGKEIVCLGVNFSTEERNIVD